MKIPRVRKRPPEPLVMNNGEAMLVTHMCIVCTICDCSGCCSVVPRKTEERAAAWQKVAVPEFVFTKRYLENLALKIKV